MSGPDKHRELRLTAEEFADGKADGLGGIEIVQGLVVRLMAQSPLHSRVVRRLAGMLEAARRPDRPSMSISTTSAFSMRQRGFRGI
ncbi:hypothetical protein [Nocardia miyunensis]|uniref:hypothetical protein n=1 Tax=Nocardia miyunensis TaxID=282684 RepID=UPI00082BD995|nr:hypothetical protein [Nocardia miyunensis]